MLINTKFNTSTLLVLSFHKLITFKNDNVKKRGSGLCCLDVEEWVCECNVRIGKTTSIAKFVTKKLVASLVTIYL